MSKAAEESFAVSHPSMLHLLLERRNDSRPRMHIYSGGKKVSSLSYQSILDQAMQRSSELRSMLTSERPFVLVEGTNDKHFVVNFFAIMLAGAIPVPVANNLWVTDERYQDIMLSIAETTQAKLLIASGSARDLLRPVKQLKLNILDVKDLASRSARHPKDDPAAHLPETHDTAYLQFSSGSTGAPKGVIITHYNLMANIEQTVEFMAVDTEKDITVCWLPFHHDMGLLAGFLIPLHNGLEAHVMNPYDFSINPARWLKLVSEVGASIITGPNSAFHMATKKVKQSTLDKLDLHSVRVAMCAAEPVSAKTLREFCNHFSPCGFDQKAFMPAYGLAENTLAVTLFDKDRSLMTDRIDTQTYSEERVAKPTNSDDCLELVACGSMLRGVEIRIVDDEDNPLPDRHIGNILIKSPSMSQGYHNRPDLNAELFHDGMLRTGDLGYLADSQVYITGRRKDVIIINGMNINAEEVERYAVKMPELRAGRLVAFPTRTADGSSERAHILVEVKTGGGYLDPRNRAALREGISRHLSRFVPIKEEQITLLPPGKVMKTTSGKVRRGEMKTQYEKGLFNYNDFQFSLAYAEYKAMEIRIKSKMLIKRFIPEFGSL